MGRDRVRLFSTRDGDRFLCPAHAKARRDQGQPVGVPDSAVAFITGMKPLPSGREPCADCASDIVE